MNLGIEFYWDFGLIPTDNNCQDSEYGAQVDLGTVFAFGTGVQKVNNKTGIVELDAEDVGADPAGSADEVRADLTAGLNQKLDIVDYVQHFRGLFSSYSALTTALPSATDGDYAHIDSGADFSRLVAIWDGDDAEWRIQQAGSVSNTDEVPEGSNNLYFTGSRVRGTPLTGLDAGTNTSILATDELLVAFAKLQAQINARNVITWANLTKIPAALAFGFAADNTQPLQVGKDADGNVYVKGVIRNTGGSSIAAFTDIMTVPETHKFKWMTSSSHYVVTSSGAYFHNIASSTNINGATFMTARASAITNWLGLSTTLPAGAVLVFPEQCIGFVG